MEPPCDPPRGPRVARRAALARAVGRHAQRRRRGERRRRRRPRAAGQASLGGRGGARECARPRDARAGGARGGGAAAAHDPPLSDAAAAALARRGECRRRLEPTVHGRDGDAARSPVLSSQRPPLVLALSRGCHRPAQFCSDTRSRRAGASGAPGRRDFVQRAE
eukprot:4387002-Prymnesium_polylepis.1